LDGTKKKWRGKKKQKESTGNESVVGKKSSAALQGEARNQRKSQVPIVQQEARN
jgi:hypothetical protein